MKYRYTLRFLDEAERELRDAVADYDAQKKGLGRRFSNELKEKLRFLRKMPMAHGIVERDIRRAVLKHFPYVVLYRVGEMEVVVLSIFYAKRDPADWQSRDL